MAEPAPAPEAPNATPPAQAAPAAAAVDDDAELPPLDHDAEVGQQIARAQELAKRAERKAAKKGTKPEPKPAEAKPEPKAEVEEKTEAEPEKPTKTAKQLLEEGDLDGALEAAFGVKADALKLNSARWAEWRKANTAAKQEIAKAKADVETREKQLAQAVERIREQAAPLLQARQAWESGDVTEAVKLAFGVDFDEFNKRGLRQFHKKASQDPEVAALKRELQAMKEERQRLEQQQLEQTTQAQREAARAQYVAQIQEQLGSSSDYELAALSRKPAFIAQVMQLQQQYWDERTNTTLPLHQAAEMVRDHIRKEWGDVYAPRDRSVSESPHRAGTKPERPVTTNLSTRGATEASPPGRALTDEELYAKYTTLAKASNG